MSHFTELATGQPDTASFGYSYAPECLDPEIGEVVSQGIYASSLRSFILPLFSSDCLISLMYLSRYLPFRNRSSPSLFYFSFAYFSFLVSSVRLNLLILTYRRRVRNSMARREVRVPVQEQRRMRKVVDFHNGCDQRPAPQTTSHSLDSLILSFVQRPRRHLGDYWYEERG